MIFLFQILLLLSCFGSALGLITFGTYSLLKTNGCDLVAYNWIPISSFSFFIFAAAFGILTLPFIIISEVMPEKLKNFGVSFCTEILWMFTFVAVKFLPFLINALQMHGSVYLFSIICILGAIYILFCIPETKGKSKSEIMKSLS